jgi:hypothetical protein
MRRFLDDDSVIDSGSELQLTTVAVGIGESHRQTSTSKVHFVCVCVCTWSQTSELHNIGNLIAG